MKKLYLTYFILVVFTLGCREKNIKDAEKRIIDTIYVKSNDLKYLTNPDSVDILCKEDVERAKKDLKEHLGVYVKTICFGCDFKPYETELEEIVKRKHFKLGIQEFSCMVGIGQTPGCYKGYIDLEMKKKFGVDYDIKIENEAEKLFIENIINKGRTINVIHLERKDYPKLLNKNLLIDSGGLTSLRTQIPIEQNSSSRVFLDLEFIVEKNGTLSNFRVSNWVNNEYKENEKVKQKLFEFAINEFKSTYNHWKPGMYKKHVVRTEQTLRVYFD